jgi:hypothetical protein
MTWAVFPDGRILYWSLFHLTISGVSFARPSTGVFFTWPYLESPLLDHLLESLSLDPLWILLWSTLYWSHHLTLSGVSFTRPSTGVFTICPPLNSPLIHHLLEFSRLSKSGSQLILRLCLSAVSVSRLSPVLYVVCPACVSLWCSLSEDSFIPFRHLWLIFVIPNPHPIFAIRKNIKFRIHKNIMVMPVVFPACRSSFVTICSVFCQ